MRHIVTALLLSLGLAASAEVTRQASTLVLGGGCFWCLEGAFEIVPGVRDVVSGYAGGDMENPDYESVSTGATGHAEVVKITYDPAVIGLDRLLDLFFEIHDPTTRDRQGADVGSQYRSIILYADGDQKRAALSAIARHQVDWKAPIVTELKPLGIFWTAEDYHQDYFKKHPDQAYCRLVVAPKVEKAWDFVIKNKLALH